MLDYITLRTNMATKYEMFMNCSKNDIDICKNQI